MKLKALITHLILATVFAVLVGALNDLVILLLPAIGWHFLTVCYVLILIGLVAFYVLTTYNRIGWSTLSFILNFVLWVAEQVNLEKSFHDTFFYQSESFRYGVLILGGLLWAINKMIIDNVFAWCKIQFTSVNRLDMILSRNAVR